MFGPIWIFAFHFTSPAITRLVPSTSWSHLLSSRIRHFPHFSMKSPRIATVLAKVANSPRCGDILCKQYHWNDTSLADPDVDGGCSTNSLAIHWLINSVGEPPTALRQRHTQTVRDSTSRYSFVIVVMNFLNPEGHWNPISAPQVTIIVAFHSFLVWLGCGSSLTSQHFACPVSLNLGDQSNSALWEYCCSKIKTFKGLIGRSRIWGYCF